MFENFLTNLFNIENWEPIYKIVRTALLMVILYLITNFTLYKLQKKTLDRAKTKKEKSNVKIFFQVAKYVVISLIIIFGILSYAGSITGIGLTAGLLSAALGWALQRPITGIAAWIMVIFKRPFEIGDRIIIGPIKGDVSRITLTHIHIKEIGGTIKSEESSGREILIPNAKLFEENITNYTQTNEEILDAIKFKITFNSDIEKMIKISEKIAKDVLKNIFQEDKMKIYVRMFFQPSGIEIQLRYHSLAVKREEISSKITQKLLKEIVKSKNIKLAYPHTEVILNKD